MRPGVRLSDTSACPRCDRCEACRHCDLHQLRSVALDTPIGVLCATLCATCVEAGRLPVLTWTQACHRVAEHCRHLGIDLDAMAALRAAEDDEEEQ